MGGNMSAGKIETEPLSLAGGRSLEQAQEIRHKLLDLHKSIIDVTRIAHERIHGRVSAGEFLGVLVEGAEYAWLRPLTALIVQLDELDEAQDPVAAQDADAWRSELASLLHADAGGSDFQRRYAELLQASPEVGLAHAAVLRALRAQKAG
jgi:hypothetical protein